MYAYDQFDQALVDERVEEFRDQTRRYLAGELTEEQFRPLRLVNGLYIQRHAPMLRIAVPYGLMSSAQLRVLASIARDFDRGYGHFTTRQNLQFNWPRQRTHPYAVPFQVLHSLHGPAHLLIKGPHSRYSLDMFAVGPVRKVEAHDVESGPRHPS